MLTKIRHDLAHRQPRWRPTPTRPNLAHCGVIGAGNSAHALSCYLTQQGHQVHLYARREEQLEHLVGCPRVRATGRIEGVFELAGVGSDPRTLARECSTLFLCTTANAYPDVVAQLAPYLQSHHQIILFSSKLCGSLEVVEELRRRGSPPISVAETDALFACRLQDDHSIWIRGFKSWNLYSSPRRSQTAQHSALMKKYFPFLEPAENLVQRGLTDFGALAHALTVLVNMNSVDRGDPFLFYYEGFTERTVVLLEQLAREFQALASAYGTCLISPTELLRRYYQCHEGPLLQAMRTVPNYSHSLAPTTLQTRYISEDVACTLVPAQQLSRLAGLSSPVLDSIVSLASVLHGCDYASTGRNLRRLGWEGLSVREIRERMDS